MNLLFITFKCVSLVFAISAVATGAQAIIDPIGFSRSFGIPIISSRDANTSKSAASSRSTKSNGDPVTSYISLMGIRQLTTGVTLLVFAYQSKWVELATILSILGVLVAGTDGVYLWRSGARSQGKFHAIPGALIALLAGTFALTNA